MVQIFKKSTDDRQKSHEIPTCFLVFAIKYSMLRPVVTIFGLDRRTVWKKKWLDDLEKPGESIDRKHQPARHEVLCRTLYLDIQSTWSTSQDGCFSSFEIQFDEYLWASAPIKRAIPSRWFSSAEGCTYGSQAPILRHHAICVVWTHCFELETTTSEWTCQTWGVSVYPKIGFFWREKDAKNHWILGVPILDKLTMNQYCQDSKWTTGVLSTSAHPCSPNLANVCFGCALSSQNCCPWNPSADANCHWNNSNHPMQRQNRKCAAFRWGICTTSRRKSNVEQRRPVRRRMASASASGWAFGSTAEGPASCQAPSQTCHEYSACSRSGCSLTCSVGLVSLGSNWTVRKQSQATLLTLEAAQWVLQSRCAGSRNLQEVVPSGTNLSVGNMKNPEIQNVNHGKSW